MGQGFLATSDAGRDDQDRLAKEVRATRPSNPCSMRVLEVQSCNVKKVTAMVEIADTGCNPKAVD